MIKNRITGAKLRRMFKYLLKAEDIFVRYVYNNNLGHHQVHKVSGKLVTFQVDAVGDDKNHPHEYKIKLTFQSGQVYEEHLPVDGKFIGFGQLIWSNSGPHCYFMAKRRK